MPAEGPYDERYCAFVDILGFGQLVDRLREGATRFEVIRDLLKIIHAPPEARFVKAFTTTDYKAQSISDAVCISALPSAVGLSHLFYSLEELTLRLLTQGFFLRGAIVRGRLYHDDRMVFGEALIRAFRLEQDVVRFPRIMVTREVVLDADKNTTDDVYGKALIEAIQQADDGPHYLHILRSFRRLPQMHEPSGARSSWIKAFNEMAMQIQQRFAESVDNPKHFEKVQWFARYWNASLPRNLGIMPISGPGVEPEPAAWG